MAEQEKTSQVQRIYEQPAEPLAFYSDLTQIIQTGHEITIQFYESIPGPPSNNGTIVSVRTRLKSTVTLSISHASNIGKILLQKVEEVKK